MLLLLLMFLMLLLLMVLLPLYGSTTAACVGVLAAADSAKQKLRLDPLAEDAVARIDEVPGALFREESAMVPRGGEVLDHLVAAIRLCNSTVVVVVMVEVVEVVVVVGLWKILLSLGFWAGPMSGVLNC
jgi:hypothetical protein